MPKLGFLMEVHFEPWVGNKYSDPGILGKKYWYLDTHTLAMSISQKTVVRKSQMKKTHIAEAADSHKDSVIQLLSR